MKWVKVICRETGRVAIVLSITLVLGWTFGLGLTLAWRVNQPSVGLVVVQGRHA